VNNDPVNYIDPWGLEDVYFLYTYTESRKDQNLKRMERWTINNDIKYLQNNNMTVAVNESAIYQDILDAFYDSETRVIITSGHGYDPSKYVGIQTADGKLFGPSALDPAKVSNNLELVIFENCYQGNVIKDWKLVLGSDVEIVAWDGLTSTFESMSFNTMGIFDRQDRNLRSHLSEVVQNKNAEISKKEK
jgi:hypothetical protein